MACSLFIATNTCLHAHRPGTHPLSSAFTKLLFGATTHTRISKLESFQVEIQNFNKHLSPSVGQRADNSSSRKVSKLVAHRAGQALMRPVTDLYVVKPDCPRSLATHTQFCTSPGELCHLSRCQISSTQLPCTSGTSLALAEEKKGPPRAVCRWASQFASESVN